MSRRLCCVIALVVATAVPGCGLMQSAQKITRESMKSLRPNANDYRDPTQEVDSEWTSVGDATRSERPLERDPDPLRNVLMTPKARSIERSLGVD